MPRLNVWEPKQLPDAAGPIGEKEKRENQRNPRNEKHIKRNESLIFCSLSSKINNIYYRSLKPIYFEVFFPKVI